MRMNGGYVDNLGGCCLEVWREAYPMVFHLETGTSTMLDSLGLWWSWNHWYCLLAFSTDVHLVLVDQLMSSSTRTTVPRGKNEVTDSISDWLQLLMMNIVSQLKLGWSIESWYRQFMVPKYLRCPFDASVVWKWWNGNVNNLREFGLELMSKVLAATYPNVCDTRASTILASGGHYRMGMLIWWWCWPSSSTDVDFVLVGHNDEQIYKDYFIQGERNEVTDSISDWFCSC